MPSIHHGKSQMDEDFAGATLGTVRVAADSGNVAAQTELGRRLARRNKGTEALRWFRSAAGSGNPERQMELGIVLFWDHGNHRDGLTWIKRAAKQGHLGAQYFLGAELATGENVRKNLKEALNWYRCAAKQGHTEAQYNLALMYWAGEGTRKNIAQAHKWLKQSARSNDLLALRALAEAYEAGQLGFRKNRARADYWRKLYVGANQVVAR